MSEEYDSFFNTIRATELYEKLDRICDDIYYCLVKEYPYIGISYEISRKDDIYFKRLSE